MIKYFWRKIEPLVDLLITGRIVTFHRALIDRGQIKRPAKERDSVELSTPDCKEYHNYQ